MLLQFLLCLLFQLDLVRCYWLQGWPDSPAPFGKLKYTRIQSIPQDVGKEHYILDFQPRLNVYEGCVPFPAVDWLGRISKGSFHEETRCHKSLGQVYARSAEVEGNFGIMYSWFFPFDLDYRRNRYRYGWQTLVVWFHSKTDLRPYVVRYTGNRDGKWLDDTKWAVYEGHINFTKRNSQLWSDTNTPGGFQPVIAWDRLSSEAKEALNVYDWGTGKLKECRFNDVNFLSEMKAAHLPPSA